MEICGSWPMTNGINVVHVTGYFLTKIYHPNVSEAGEICVNALKKDWKPDLGIAHVLKVIWCLLLVPFPESSLNDEVREAPLAPLATWRAATEYRNLCKNEHEICF